MQNSRFMAAGLISLTLLLATPLGCTSTAPRDESGRQKHGLTLSQEVEIAIGNFLEADPGLQEFFDDSYAYAVFPEVGKGGVIVGGAYGEGCVYEQGRHVGYAELSQGTIGLQLGGQTFSEVIFFKYKSALDRFREGSFEFSANASAVAVTAGSSAAADFESGVAVFTLARGGLMVEASVGGQKFTYEPK